MSGWDFDGGDSKKAEFTKFPEGITRIRIIDDAPSMRWTHWLPQFKRSVNCPGKGCPICEIRNKQKANKEPQTYGVSKRIAINILNRETGKQEVMEQGVGFFADLRDLMEDLRKDGKTLRDTDIKVRRRGTGKDNTSYRLDIDDEYPLTEADIVIANEKTDLSTFFKPNTIEQITRIVNGESWDDVMKSAVEEDAPEENEDFELK